MLPTTLVSAVRERRAILFVGAGVSMNLGLPSFRQLVSHIGEELDFDADIFHTFGDYQSLAEYYVLDKRIGPLRSWMDRSWHPGSIDIKNSEVHRLIVELNFPIIYTTNYGHTRRAEERFIRLPALVTSSRRKLTPRPRLSSFTAISTTMLRSS
jgi:hypothetical protein